MFVCKPYTYIMKLKITLLAFSIVLTSCGMLKPASSNQVSSFAPSNNMATVAALQAAAPEVAKQVEEQTTGAEKEETVASAAEKATETVETSNATSEKAVESAPEIKPLPSSADIDFENEVVDDNSITNFSGRLIIANNELYFQPNSCAYRNENFLLSGLNGKKFKHKKWIKRVKKSQHKYIDNVVLKGVKSSKNPVILVKKASKPLKKRKTWSSGQSALYLQAAQELYQRTIALREEYKVFSVNIEEVEDPVLGKVTEYSIYDKSCNKLTPEQIKNISDKDLNGLNSAVKIGGGLLLKQAALTGLAALSTNEIATCSYFEKIQCTKDAVTAAVFQTAIVAQLPKIVKNLKEAKKHIEQLKSE